MRAFHQSAGAFPARFRMGLTRVVSACALMTVWVPLALLPRVAQADCVNFSQQRADRAGAALARNPPKAAQLGLPSLDGLTLNAPKTAGDPQCASPGPKRYYYTTAFKLSDLVGTLYPNIRRRVETDGMGRVWFRNPRLAEQIFLTSGTELTVQTRGDGSIWQIVVIPAATVAALTTEQQPYSVADIVEGTPWPGGASGPRQFVRADGAGGVGGAAAAVTPPPATAPAAAPAPAVAGAASPAAPAGCPPAGTAQQAGAAVGAELGAAVGGALGRSLGGAFGGLMGAGQPRPAAPPGCP